MKTNETAPSDATMVSAIAMVRSHAELVGALPDADDATDPMDELRRTMVRFAAVYGEAAHDTVRRFDVVCAVPALKARLRASVIAACNMVRAESAGKAQA